MKRDWVIGAAAGVSAALSPMACAHASAAPASSAGATTSAARVKELERRLDERDALIRDLQQRVERLERQQSASGSATANTQAQAPAPPQTVARASPGPPGPPASTQGPPKPGGAGEFTVSEEAAQHALERALVQSGAALLPRGKFEFSPNVIYQYQRLSTPGQLALTTDGQVLITENVLRSVQVQTTALLRMGLPWNAQLEVGVPFNYKDTTLTSRVGGSGLSATGPSVYGVGDPSVSLIKQILVENDLRPGLFANIGWSPDSGQVKQGVPLGRGYGQLGAGFTAVKRQDPLVFQGGFNFLYSGQNNGLRPGAQYITSFGVILAVSPETSLQFGQQLTFYGKDSFNGRGIPGSDRTAGIFTAGILSILGRNRVISMSIGIGETADAPNIVVQLATPIRLN